MNQALVHLLAEEHLLAMAQVDGVVRAQFAVADEAVYSLVEDYAVLEHFDNRRSAMACGSNQNFL